MSVPIIRFNSFSEDWRLESISSVISNKSKKYDPIKAIEDLPCIELEHLSQQTGEILDTISGKDQKSIKNIFDENSVLFGKLRPYLRKFARPNFKGVCSSEIWVLKSKKLHSDFLFQYIQTDSFFELTQIQAGSKMPRADWESISKGEIYFPNAEEQTKIASFLSAVDEKISQLTQKHQLLSQYKQGMMQKLFSQQIRFKADDGSEFEEWSNKTIGDIANIKRGASPRPITDSKWFDESSNIGWVRISDVSKSKKYLLETEQYLSPEGIQKSRLVPKGNLIMSICATIGKPIYTGFDVCIHDGFVVFSELQAIHEYAYYYLEFIEKNWYQYGQPGTQVNLNSDIVSNEEFPFPCLEEQTKIANFLSSIDQKIDVASEQLEQAKLWKKGLLQQMFV